MKNDPPDVSISHYDYNLPSSFIASHPLEERDRSRLLIVEEGQMTDAHFKNIASYLPSNSRLVLNDTKVIEARIFFQKDSGGTIEIFCLEPKETSDISMALMQTSQTTWHCLIGGAAKWKHGLVLEKKIQIENTSVTLSASFVSRLEGSFLISFSWTDDFTFAEVLHAAGAIPLPPYMKRKAEEEDANRYQTIFAQHQGSVAAPTASLHFTDSVLHKLSEKNIQPTYITLHVGAGTFKPVTSETIAGHLMHGEDFIISKKSLIDLINAPFITAAGTTSLRTLETLYWLGIKLRENNSESIFKLGQWEAYHLPNDLSYQESLSLLVAHLERSGKESLTCRTSLLIMPGYTFRSAQALITNFHQPRSTLLLLVAAFIGEGWKKVYDHALENGYRFLSYGDSSLLWRKD
ncbi:MAG: S-adenosylmethionine:tRNA ribosyltransferase-isomerase [Chitinophagaceae bacterium]